MNIPALEAVRRSNPDAEITVIARSWVEDVVSFRPDLVDRCLSFDDRVGALGLIQFIRRLREERFDIAFTFLNHIKGSIILALAGIPIRVGFRKLETRFFLTNHLDRKSMPKDRHQYEDYLDLVEGAGFSIEPRPGPRLDPDFELRKKLAAELLTGLPQPMLAIQAGAAFGTAKRWLPERYALTARQFIERTNGSVILLGSQNEDELNESILRGVGHERVRNFCGRTGLRESMALISMADLFISGDSGLAHVAAAFGVPQVAIFGPTDPNHTFPSNPLAEVLYHKVSCGPCFERHCPPGHHDCMRGVTVDKVMGAGARVMSRAVHAGSLDV